MLIPVRCFSCGKVIAHLWDQYDERTKAGEDAAEVLEDLGVISEAQEKKVLALIKKYKKAILIALPSLVAVALMINSLL